MTAYRTAFLWVCAVIATLLALAGDEQAKEKSHKMVTVSPRKMADSLHQLLAVQQEVYSRQIVQRLALETKKLGVSQEWQKEGNLPVHAQFLRQTAVEIATQGAEFSFALRSLWPINPSQGPQTDIEKKAMESLVRDPGSNVYGEELLGGRSYFTAIYPCRASLTSCAECHNKHPGSVRHDFKTNDVMGALVIRVPLEF